MSSLQDFARLQLQDPGQLDATPAPAPPPVPAPVPVPPPTDQPPPVSAPTDVPMAPVRQDAPTAAQFGAGAEAMEPPAPNLNGPHALIKAEEHDERQARTDRDKAFGLQADAAQQGAKIEADKAAQLQPLLNQHTQQLNDDAHAQQQMYDQLHAVGQKAAADYQANVQALSDKMANQPRDMFGRAGVNKISGIIGLILGGLGGGNNGPKNMAVERLNQLTDQKLAQDKYEFEMLGKKADMSKNLYAQLRTNGMDDIAAHNAVSAVHKDMLLAQMAAVENSYAPAKAKNDLQKTIADLTLQRTNALEQGSQHKYGQAMQAYGLIQKDREMQLQRDIAEMRFTPKNGIEEANPIVNDVHFNDPHFGKNNKAVMGRLQVQDQAIKEAYAQAQQYHQTDNYSPLKRAGLRKGIAGSLATADVGNARVSEARVKAAETETGADPAIHIGPIEFGQKGIFTNGLDDRIDQALRTRLEVYYKSLKAAGGTIQPGSELARIFKAMKVGDEYGLEESPSSIARKEQSNREVALDALKKMGK